MTLELTPPPAATDSPPTEPFDDPANQLAERLGSRRGARLPVGCSPGDAWKLAGRRQSW